MTATAAPLAGVLGVIDLDDLADAGLLSEATEVEGILREAEVHKLRVAYQWAIAHPALDASETPAGAVLPAVLTTPETLGGAGTPAVAAFTPEPLAVALGCSPAAASSLLADALDLHHRLPLLWDHTAAGLVPAWKARRVASRTRHLTFDATGWVDRQVAGRVSSLAAPALDRIVAEAAARCEDPDVLEDRAAKARAGWDVVLVHPDPAHYTGTSELRATGDTLDLTRFHDVVCAEAEALGQLGDADTFEVRKAKALGVIADAQARLDLTLVEDHDRVAYQAAREQAIARRDAKVRLYLHASLTDIATAGASAGAVGTVEGIGPVTLETIKEWAGRSRLTIQPVIHVAADDRWSVDQHDPPPRMADEVRLRDEACVFPWCGRRSRQCDLDHRDPYVEPDDGGPPGQTTPANLTPLCRRHHRAKTTGAWTYERTAPGTYLWTGPAGLTVIVTPQGTVTAPGC